MKLKVGIIGAGNMGKNHIRLVREMNSQFEFVGVFDPDVERVKELGLEKEYYENQERLISDSDALIVAAPSSLHKKIAFSIAEANKHLLLEKPIALSLADAEEIVEKYRQNDSILQIGHVERFNPVVVELEKILANEEIIALHIERCSSYDKRIADTDVVYDLMIHDVDVLINGLLPNQKITECLAKGRKAYSDKHVDYVESIMTFDDGAIASIISSRTTESKIRRIAVHCKNSFIDADLLHQAITISRKTIYNLDIGYNPVYRQENIVEKVFVPNEEPLRAELKHFYDCVINDKMPKTSGESALRSMAVLDRINKDVYAV